MLGRTALRYHNIELDAVALDSVVEGGVTDGERVAVDDRVRPVIDLLTVLVVGIERAVGPKRVRMLDRWLGIRARI
jgi:hypothetical protein